MNSGAAERKNSGEGLKGETRIRVGRSPVGGEMANPRKSCNRFLNNYKTEFGLKHLICGASMDV